MDQPAQIITEPTPPPVPVSPQPPVLSKKASKIPLIFLIVLIIGIVGVAAFWLRKSSGQNLAIPTPTLIPTIFEPTPTQTEIDITTPTPDPTANWITYKTIAGLEFKCPADIHVCDFQNFVYLEYGFKSLCQDMESRKKSLLTQGELDTAIKDFKNRINNKFTETEISIEYDGDQSKITSFNEIINEDRTNFFAWFKFPKGYYYAEISEKDEDVSFLFDKILSTFRFD